MMMDDKGAQQDKSLDIVALNSLLKRLQKRGVQIEMIGTDDLHFIGKVADSEKVLIDSLAPLILERLRQHRIEVCPRPDKHRGTWYYAGNDVFICDNCRRFPE